MALLSENALLFFIIQIYHLICNVISNEEVIEETLIINMEKRLNDSDTERFSEKTLR
jgi:hypothetical protein